MAAKTTLKSLKNRLSDSFNQIANMFLGYKSIESQRYTFTLVTPKVYETGTDWLEATPTFEDPTLYTISQIRHKKTGGSGGKESKSNIKITDDSGAPQLFSFSDTLKVFDAFHKEKELNIESQSRFNAVSYKLQV